MRLVVPLIWVAGAACGGVPSEPADPSDSDPAGSESQENPTTPDDPVPPVDGGPGALAPLYGGTVAVNGPRAVAADPGLDVVVFWQIGERAFEGRVDLERGSEPFRVAFGADQVFVTLRGSGEVAAFDPATQELTRRQAVCPEPRGVDATDESLWVACASGEVVQLDPATLSVRATHWVQPDLRDIVVDGDTLWVSRLRSAEVLQLSHNGAVQGRFQPDPTSATGPFAVPRVAWRMRSHPDGGVMVLHQSARTRALPGNGMPDGPLPTADTGVPQVKPGPVVYYGAVDRCVRHPLVSAHFTHVASDGTVVTGGPLLRQVLAVDFDIGADGTVYLASRDEFTPRVNRVTDPLGPSTCRRLDMTTRVNGIPTGVAVNPEGAVVGVSRSPSMVFDGSYQRFGRDERPTTVSILDRTGATGVDSAYLRFHRDPGTAITCATCHPEGQDDGHTWVFAGVGFRRTQNLSGGLLDRAPFHWGGELETFEDLMDDVFTVRMGEGEITAALSQELAVWLDDLEPVQTTPEQGPEAIERGRALFEDPTVGCTGCHFGEQYSDFQLHVVTDSGEATKTPSLLGVGSRAPYMHTGCAETLHQRFTDPACGGGDLHGRTSALSRADIDAMVAFLRTL